MIILTWLGTAIQENTWSNGTANFVWKDLLDYPLSHSISFWPKSGISIYVTWRRFFAWGRNERRGSTAVTCHRKSRSTSNRSTLVSPRHLWASLCAGGARSHGSPSTPGGSSTRGQSRTWVGGNARQPLKSGLELKYGATCARLCGLPGGTSCARKRRRALC